MPVGLDPKLAELDPPEPSISSHCYVSKDFWSGSYLIRYLLGHRLRGILSIERGCYARRGIGIHGITSS